MKQHACLMTRVAVVALLWVIGATAAQAADTIGELLTKIASVGATPTQENYSRELQKSVNEAAVAAIARDCAQQKGEKAPATFTLVGVISIDGAMRAPFPVPDTAFGACVSSNIAATHFPLPPGDGHGWPVAVQFDASTGKAIYVAGDKQIAVPQYSATAKWVHTPLPERPAKLTKKCTASVWLSLDNNGRIKSAEPGGSDCPAQFNAAAVAATRQWLGISKQKAASGDAMDLRVSFVLRPGGMRVTL